MATLLLKWTRLSSQMEFTTSLIASGRHTHAPHARTNSALTLARSWFFSFVGNAPRARTGRLRAQPPAASVRLNRLGCPCSIASHQNARAHAVWFRLTPACNPDLTGLAPRRAPTSAFGPDLDPGTPTSQGLAPRRAPDHSLGPRPTRGGAQTCSPTYTRTHAPTPALTPIM